MEGGLWLVAVYRSRSIRIARSLDTCHVIGRYLRQIGPNFHPPIHRLTAEGWVTVIQQKFLVCPGAEEGRMSVTTSPHKKISLVLALSLGWPRRVIIYVHFSWNRASLLDNDWRVANLITHLRLVVAMLLFFMHSDCYLFSIVMRIDANQKGEILAQFLYYY